MAKSYKEKFRDEDGVWRTIGGRRVFIRTGQSLSEAMKESGKFRYDKMNREHKKYKIEQEIKEAKENQTHTFGERQKAKRMYGELSEEYEKANNNYKEALAKKDDWINRKNKLERENFNYQMQVEIPNEMGIDIKQEQLDRLKEVGNIGNKEQQLSDIEDREARTKRQIETDYALDFGDSSDNYRDTKDVPFSEKKKAVEINKYISEKEAKDEFSKSQKTGNDYLPKASKVMTSGTSNRKEVSDNIQAHILEYYDNPVDFMEQMDAMDYLPTRWHAGEELAKGGSYAIYYDDQREFLNSLNINPKGKDFSDDRVFEVYTSLVGRESERLYNRLEKLYDQYKKEHKSSNVSLDDFRKWFK